MSGMTAGSVDRYSIDPSGAITGTGFALLYYNFTVAQQAALHDSLGNPTPNPPPAVAVGDTNPPFSTAVPATADNVATMNDARVRVYQSFADEANRVTQFILYLQSNGVARVTPADSVGRVPSSIVAGQAIDPPSAAVDLSIF